MAKKKVVGRPKVPDLLRREVTTVRLPLWLIQWLDAQDKTNADLIEEAVLKHFNPNSLFNPDR